MAINLPIVSTFDGKGVTGAITGIKNLGAKLLGLGAIVAGAFAVRAVVNFAQESLTAAQAVEVANNRLKAVADATQVFGFRTEYVTGRLIEFAEAQEMIIGKDAEMIKGVQAVLLSFKSLSASAGQTGGVFERATKAAFDMAAGLQTGVEPQAMALAKALENPIRGVSALTKAGTVFTEQQKEQIKVLVQSGDLLGAQTLILNEVESQYSGVAAATATWSERMALAFDNIKEAAGKALLPIFEKFAKFMVEEVIPPVVQFFEDDFPVFLEKFQAAWAGLQPTFETIGDAIRRMFDIPDDKGVIEGLLDRIAALEANPEFEDFINGIVDGFQRWWPEIEKLLPQMLQLAEELLPLLIQLLPVLIPLIGILTIGFANLVLALVRVGEQWGAVSGNAGPWTKAIVAVSPLLTAFITMWNNLANAIKAAYDWWIKWQNSGAGSQSGTNRFQGLSGGRAMGGPVTSGSMYAVGERGPELFVPSQNGRIIPNSAMGGGATYNITINAGIGTDPVRVGEYVVTAIKRYERASGPVFASA